MKKFCLMTLVLSLGLLVSSVASGADCPQVVYQTDFSNNKGWQTNNADNYYLDSLAPGGSSAYYQRLIDPTCCPGDCEDDGEYAYHLLPGLKQNVKWCLEFDILPVSRDWAADGGLALTDETMNIGGMCPANNQYLYMNYGSEDRGYLADLCWRDSLGNGGDFQAFYYTPGKWYENLIEWDPDKSEFYVLIKERGGVTLVDKIVTISDPDVRGIWPTEFNSIDRLAMSTVGDPYAPGATGISYIDNIEVSIPEPATVLLLGLGGLALLRRKRGYGA